MLICHFDASLTPPCCLLHSVLRPAYISQAGLAQASRCVGFQCNQRLTRGAALLQGPCSAHAARPCGCGGCAPGEPAGPCSPAPAPDARAGSPRADTTATPASGPASAASCAAPACCGSAASMPAVLTVASASCTAAPPPIITACCGSSLHAGSSASRWLHSCCAASPGNNPPAGLAGKEAGSTAIRAGALVRREGAHVRSALQGIPAMQVLSTPWWATHAAPGRQHKHMARVKGAWRGGLQPASNTQAGHSRTALA